MCHSVMPVLSENQSSPQETLTFEEYRFYEGEPDVRYELYKGKLIPRATATILHTKICEFLVYKLQRYLADQNLELVAKTSLGVRTKDDSSRIPDVVVCTQSLLEQAAARLGAGILELDETPRLVVEVVSENRRQDYVIKRAEYEQANVPEYWIVDPTPNKQRVRVLTLSESEEGYEAEDFLPGQEIVSVQFPNLILSVNEMLDPPLVEALIKEEQAQQQQLEQQVNEERQRAEQERQRAEQERQRAEQERQRAKQLARWLREMGEDPDSV